MHVMQINSRKHDIATLTLGWLVSLINKLADSPPNYYKIAKTFPHNSCNLSFNDLADSNEPTKDVFDVKIFNTIAKLQAYLNNREVRILDVSKKSGMKQAL